MEWNQFNIDSWNGIRQVLHADITIIVDKIYMVLVSYLD